MLRSRSAFVLFAFAALLTGSSASAGTQSGTIPTPSSSSAPDVPGDGTNPDATGTLAKYPWETEAFFNGGFGTGNRDNYSFLSVGAHLGKVLTDPVLPGILRGQFEYAGDIMPWWQGRTPKFERANCYGVPGDVTCTSLYPTGGAYNGLSITPIILRWNFVPRGHREERILPFVQGAGGLLWTNHKFPPVGPYQQPGHQGASVFNFTPQFGVGVQYFLNPHRSLTFQANAVHISSASLGDTNPGVNASVQFTIGYTWWK